MREDTTPLDRVVSSGTIPSPYPPLAVFEKLPKTIAAGSVAAFTAMLLLVVLPMLWIFRITQHQPFPVSAMPILALLPLAWLGGRIYLPVSLRLMARQSNHDKEKFNPAPLEHHVGVAYCGNLWFLNGDNSWDRGYVAIDERNLNFRGYGPAFTLPLRQISSVWMGRSDLLLSNGLPRLFVEWIHPSGRPNIFSLEIRNQRSFATTWARAHELANEIRERVRCAKPPQYKEAVWPFESSTLEFTTAPGRQAINWTDRITGAAYGGVTVLVFLLIGKFFKSVLYVDAKTYLIAIAAFACPAVYRAVVFNRVCRRGKGVAAQLIHAN